MNSREQPDSQVSDRRRHRRRGAENRVRLTVPPTSIMGVVENLSRSGLLFFSEGNFRVIVEVEENGAITKKNGRLIRAQRMRGDSFGWAIEFDP